MIDHRPSMETTAWQVTVKPQGKDAFTANIYASSLHEARMMGATLGPRPNTNPCRVLDVCLLEVARARQQATSQALGDWFKRRDRSGHVFIRGVGMSSMKNVFNGV